MAEKYHVTTETLKNNDVVVTEDSFASVVFATPFPSVPSVTVTPISNDPMHTASVFNKTVNGFDVYLNKTGGGPAGEVTVDWIATCIGCV